MAARFECCNKFNAPLPRIIAAVEGALRDIRAYSVEWSPDRLHVSGKTSVNWWSWGERLIIDIYPSGEVNVLSECALFTQIIDWGKNSQNCRRIVSSIYDRLESNIFG